MSGVGWGYSSSRSPGCGRESIVINNNLSCGGCSGGCGVVGGWDGGGGCDGCDGFDGCR